MFHLSQIFDIVFDGKMSNQILIFWPFFAALVGLCSAALANETRKAVLWESSELDPTDLAPLSFLPSKWS